MTSEPVSTENRNERQPVKRSPGAHCASDRCSRAPYVDLPLCEDHAWDLWAEMSARRESIAEMADAENRRIDWANEIAARNRARLEAKIAGTDRSEPGIIYYVQIGEQVKIGYTTNLAVRLASYPPMATLRATHPGTMRVEADMHAQFSKYLAGGREWFHHTQELEDHITRVKSDFKQDALVA